MVRYLVEWCADEEFSGATAATLRDVAATPVSPELLPPTADGEIAQVTEDHVGPYRLHDFFLHHLLRLPFGLVISAPGLARFISVAIKSWISVQMAILLAATTRFPDILMAMRALRLPRLLVAIIGLMWRYLFVLADEVLRLIRARAARSGEVDAASARSGGSVIWRARVTGGMAGNLLLRAFERSDRIYTAMLSRGYDGEVRSLPLPPLKPQSWLVLLGGLGMLGLLTALGFLMGA